MRDIQKADAVKLYLEGWGFRKINEKTGLPVTTIKRHVIKLGIHRANNFCGGKSKGHQDYWTNRAVEYDPMKYLVPAVEKELKSFKKGDELSHWYSHPEAVKWRARRYYSEHADCYKARAMAYQRTGRGRARRKAYNAKPERRERMKEWRAMPENKAKQAAYHRAYVNREDVKPRLREKRRVREKRSRQSKDNLYYARKWRGRLRAWFKTGYPKYLNEIIGCSLSTFRGHIASQFDDGMRFDNYGTVWEFDHMIPCCAFDLSNMTEVKLCFHYNNTRPIRPLENARKIATDLKLKEVLRKKDG